MTKREITQRLRDEHQRQWQYAEAAAQVAMKNHPEMGDEEIAESLKLISASISGIVDAANALGVDLEKLSGIDAFNVLMWRRRMADLEAVAASL